MSTPKATDGPPARSLNRQIVLEEDEYTEALAHIIARDFFPSLVHLGATNNYLDAVQSQDPDRITATVRRLEELNTPVTRRGGPSQSSFATPYGGGGFDTPLHTPRGEAPSKRPRYNTNMGLDAFQAKYTSEDNSSFLEILDDENKKRKEKYGWAWEAQKRVEEQRDKMIKGRERLLIEAPDAVGVREKLRIEQPAPIGLITQGESSSSMVSCEQGTSQVLLPAPRAEDEEEVDLMAPLKDKRPAGVDGWKFKTRNALMFAPDADVSPHVYSSTEKVPPDPKSIKHGNTRLPEQDDSTTHIAEPPSPTRSRIDAAIAGTQYQPRSPNSKNFPLVAAMPSPKPSELGPAAVKQLMTWGTLNATPRIISSSEDSSMLPSTPFHLPAPSSRERISHQLSSNASKSLRAKAELLGGRTPGISRTPMAGRSKRAMGPPTWTPKRADATGGLTPAAKRLLNRTMATRRSDAMERTSNWQGTSKAKEKDVNRIRWTPTPSPVARRE